MFKVLTDLHSSVSMSSLQLTKESVSERLPLGPREFLPGRCLSRSLSLVQGCQEVIAGQRVENMQDLLLVWLSGRLYSVHCSVLTRWYLQLVSTTSGDLSLSYFSKDGVVQHGPQSSFKPQNHFLQVKFVPKAVCGLAAF